MAMEIYVYDTYVKAKDGHTMHFDVYSGVRDDAKAVEQAKQWLEEIGEGDAVITSKECNFCHVDSRGVPEPIEKQIKEKGFYIYKMENCP